MIILYILLVLLVVILARTLMFTPPKAEEKTFAEIEQDSEASIRTMAYYDVVNFARYVTCPTFLTWGFNDDTCPPTTSYAVWNTLHSEKDCLITPINEHWTSDETNRKQMEWLKMKGK